MADTGGGAAAVLAVVDCRMGFTPVKFPLASRVTVFEEVGIEGGAIFP